MMDSDIDTESSSGWRWWWPSWRPTSASLLKSAEAKILACLKNNLCARFVTLPNQERIWTLTVTNNSPHKRSKADSQMPLVMVHGFGGGVGLWIQNLDPLCHSRPVHAFDLLGFGRSSRPHFPSDATLAEEQYVSSIEQWRQAMGLERMILLGHSLGGYLATAYAIQYPERVTHLILADPWGFPERSQPDAEVSGRSVVKRQAPPRWVKALASVASLFNPLAVIRAAGPWGPGLVNRFRPDFRRKFESLFDDDTMTDYIYHCNAQNPRYERLVDQSQALVDQGGVDDTNGARFCHSVSGEVGFRAMCESLGWAKRPMLQRVHLLPPGLPVTLLYGSLSWVDRSSGDQMRQVRPDSYTRIVVIHASHHVYADEPEEFNRVVERICSSVD